MVSSFILLIVRTARIACSDRHTDRHIHTQIHTRTHLVLVLVYHYQKFGHVALLNRGNDENCSLSGAIGYWSALVYSKATSALQPSTTLPALDSSPLLLYRLLPLSSALVPLQISRSPELPVTHTALHCLISTLPTG